MTVDVDSARFLPRVQTLRFETPEQSVEFRLTAEIRTMQQTELVAAVFEPKLPETRATLPAAPALPGTPRAPSTEPRPVTAVAAESNIAREIEALYSLHRAGACMGDPVRISEESDGVRIGRVGSTESYLASGKIGDVLAEFAELRRGPAAGDDDSRHAIALQFLAERFPATVANGVPAEPRRLLDLMAKEHASAVLDEIQNMGVRTTLDVLPDVDWRAGALRLSEDMRRLRQHHRVGDSTTPDIGSETLAGLISIRRKK
jgi:hypothetical protein